MHEKSKSSKYVVLVKSQKNSEVIKYVGIVCMFVHLLFINDCGHVTIVDVHPADRRRGGLPSSCAHLLQPARPA